MCSFESCGLIDLESKLVPGSSAENRAADRRWQSFAINSLSIDPFVLRTVFVLPLISSPIAVSSSSTSANGLASVSIYVANFISITSEVE